MARTVRGYLVAFTEGDGKAACRLLAPDYRVELVEQVAKLQRRRRRPSCERAVSLQGAVLAGADLERLARSRVTKVGLRGTVGTAEVQTPAQRGHLQESHTVAVREIQGKWRLASNFFPGALRGGSVPRPPPPPPANPVEEHKIAAIFERFRAALERGDGKAACDLRTPAARQTAVAQAVDAAGGRHKALTQYGGLTCAAVSAGLRVPHERVRQITVTAGRGKLTLVHGATYGFRKLDGNWRLDA